MKAIYINLLLVILCASLNTEKLLASHGVAADITYQCINPNTGSYAIQLIFYRDCAGINVQSSLTMSARLNGGTCMPPPPNPNNPNINFTVTLQSSSEVSPLCDTMLSRCNGGPQPGIKRYVYAGQLTIGTGCSDLIVSFTHCCRANSLANITNPGSSNLYVQTLINSNHPNWMGNGNNSVQFNNIPILYTCAGQASTYNPLSFDPDGDSLVFRKAVPLINIDQSTVNYVVPYSAQEPFCSNGTYNLDSTNGQISFVACANTNGTQLLSMLIDEYRNGVLIGQTRRDIVVIISNSCTNTISLQDSIFTNNGIITGNNSSTQILSCDNSSITLNAYFSDTNPANVLTPNSDIGLWIPGASFSYSYSNLPDSNQIVVTFQIPSGLAVGAHDFFLSVKNNVCPFYNIQHFAYRIVVRDLTCLAAKSYVCSNTSDSIQLQATGIDNNTTGSFSWSPAGMLNNPNIANPMAYLSGQGSSFYCTFTEGNCTLIDSVSIQLAAAPSIMPIADISLCNSTAVVIASSPNTVSFHWSPASNLSCNNCDTVQITGPIDTSYMVVAIDSLGCTDSTNFHVLLNTPLAIPNLSCVSNSTDEITFNWAAIPNVAGYLVSVNNGSNTLFNSNNFTIDNLFPSSCMTIRVSALSSGICPDSPADSATCCTMACFSQVNSSVTPVSCNGLSDGTATVTPIGPSAPTYLWSSGNQNSQTATGLSAGVYTVTINEGLNCSLVHTVTVTEPAALSASLSVTHVSGQGNSDGSISATVSGGNPPYTYFWSGSSGSGANITGLSSGIYIFAVMDTSNCIFADTVSISEPLGFNSFSEKEQAFILFPNPSSTLIYLQNLNSSELGDCQAIIMNVNGQTIQKLQIPSGTLTYEINVEALAPALYILQLTTNKGYRQQLNFIKQ